MKRTLSMIYRFIFIIFSVWGICGKIGFNILTLTPKILNFTLFIDILCFLCILAVFIISLITRPFRIINLVKTALTLSALIVFVNNLTLLGGGITYDWILGVLLPGMMFVDWLIFDAKGNIKPFDVLIWLGIACALIALLGLILKSVFGITNLFDVMGIISDYGGLMGLLLKALGIGIALYVFDFIGVAFSKQRFGNAFSVIYRLIFLLLELYAFINTVGTELTQFLFSLRYYHLLSNFLCVVCIGVLMVYNVVRHKSARRNQNPFPSLKGAFTVCILITMVSHIVFDARFLTLSFSQIIFYYIAPVMMLFDWILLDKKGLFKIIDPLLWLIIPFLYFVAAITYIVPKTGVYYELFSLPQPEMFVVCAGAIVAGGYVLYIVDKILSRRK